MASDAVNHPSHYNNGEFWHSKCGKPVECIDIVRHMDFNIGNAVKYLWRAGKKNDELEDLRKANWYIADRICELEREREEAKKDELAIPTEPDATTHITTKSNAVCGGPGEFWVLRTDTALSASSAWTTFNTSGLLLSHPARETIRQELLTLMSRMPPSEFDKLAPQAREAVVDWQWARDEG